MIIVSSLCGIAENIKSYPRNTINSKYYYKNDNGIAIATPKKFENKERETKSALKLKFSHRLCNNGIMMKGPNLLFMFRFGVVYVVIVMPTGRQNSLAVQQPRNK